MKLNWFYRVVVAVLALLVAALLHYSGDTFWLKHYLKLVNDNGIVEKVSGEELLRSWATC